MDALDLAVITGHPEPYRAMLAVCSSHHALPPPAGEEWGLSAESSLGALRPDFGPAYRAVIIRLDPHGPPDALARIVRALRPPYTVMLGTATGLPESRLRLGDVAISRTLRSATDPRGSHAIDAGLLRGALALDAVDHRWTQRITRPPPIPSADPPRLVAGTLASGPLDDAGATALHKFGEQGHRVIAVDFEGIDATAAATTAALEGLSGRVVMLRGIDRLVTAAAMTTSEPGPRDPEWTAYAATAAAAFLEAWVRHAWPTRPASAETGQTPKGTRVTGHQRHPLGATTSTTTTGTSRAIGSTRPPEALASVTRPSLRARSGSVSGSVSSGPGSSAGNSSGQSSAQGSTQGAAHTPSTQSGPLQIPAPRSRAMTGPLPPINENKYATPGSGPVSLRARLARIYPTIDDARRVVSEAGLVLDRIDFGGGADVRWHKILTEARLVPGGVERLLAVIVREGH
jgi:hypothetical protein